MHTLLAAISLPWLLLLLSGLGFILFGTIDQAQASINTLLKLGDAASPEVFTTIANVNDISMPNFSGNVVDVTSHSTNNPWRRKIVTLLEGGELTCKLFFIPSSAGPDGHNNATGLLKQFTSRTLSNYKLVFPDTGATTWQFQAQISKFALAATVAGVLEATVTFTITGQPTLA